MDKVGGQGRKITILLEAGNLEFKDGNFTVARTDRWKTLGEVALTAYVLWTTSTRTSFYDPKNFTYRSGAAWPRSRSIPKPGR